MGYSLEEIRDLWDDDQHFPTVESLEEDPDKWLTIIQVPVEKA